MNVVLKDDFNFSGSESEYFSSTDEEYDDSSNELSDPFYEGDTESNSLEEQEWLSDSSSYEQSVDDIIEILSELDRDYNSDYSDNELKIYREEGSDTEEFESDNESSNDSFDSDSDYDEEFISYVIRNAKYQLKKMMMALTPMIMRTF